MANRTEVLEADSQGTRIDQEFRTRGIIPNVMGHIFAIGSYHGTFQGELNAFARIAEAEEASADRS